MPRVNCTDITNKLLTKILKRERIYVAQLRAVPFKRDANIFQKSGSHLEILCARPVT